MDWIGLLSAVATTASAGVIAWQAMLTRRSLKVSEKALDETRLVRLEGRAPRVFLHTYEYPTSENATMRDYTFAGTDPVGIPEGQVFALPRHATWEIRWSFPITITNDGPGSVVPEFDAPFGITWVEGDGRLVPAGEAHEFTVHVIRTVEEWIEAADAAHNEPKVKTARLGVSIHGPNDSDVSDSWEITVWGSLLDHPADDRNAWAHLTQGFYGSLRVEVERQKRIYWRSRSEGAPLQVE